MTRKVLLVDAVGFLSLYAPLQLYRYVEHNYNYIYGLFSIIPLLLIINFVWRKALRYVTTETELTS